MTIEKKKKKETKQTKKKPQVIRIRLLVWRYMYD